MPFSHFLPSVRWNAVIRTWEVKSPPRCRMCIRRGRSFQTIRKQHLCLLSAQCRVWIGFTEYFLHESFWYSPKTLLFRHLKRLNRLYSQDEATALHEPRFQD